MNFFIFRAIIMFVNLLIAWWYWKKEGYWWSDTLLYPDNYYSNGILEGD